jgi:replicative DNA helicase
MDERQGQQATAPLPHNIEAEAALLGAMMCDNRLIDQIADRLMPDHFFEPLHQRIYSAIVREQALGRSVTPVTLKPYFDGDPAMKEVGGPAYLAQLTGSGAAIIGARDFARQIEELALLRTLITTAETIAAKARDTSEDVSPARLIAEAEASIAAVSRGEVGLKELSAAECIAAAQDAIDRQDPGITCGITAIDRSMGPIRKGNLAIIAARPGMGKTCVAVSYAIGAAKRRLTDETGKERQPGVLFISLEMTAEELGERMACDLAFEYQHQLPYQAVVDGRLSPELHRSLAKAHFEMRDLPIQVIDASGLTVHRIGTIVRRWKRRFEARGQRLDLVIVDYLQKVAGSRGLNRFEAITEISQGLKEIAKLNEVGVLALAQLSRKVEERPDKRPQLSDLRESGQIEQDADIVTFLLRDEYYLAKAEPAQHDEAKHDAWRAALDLVAGEIDFICAKRRKGRETTAKGRFYGAYQAVRDAR